MKNIKRIITASIAALTILSTSSVKANAEWRQNSTGWWYTEGSSWVTGWKQIDGKWYLFDSNGYMKTGWQYDRGNWYYFYANGVMAYNTTIDGYHLNESGAWTTSIKQNTSVNTNTESVSSVISSANNVYVSKNGVYHKAPNAHGMVYYTEMSREKAINDGYRACEAKHCP